MWTEEEIFRAGNKSIFLIGKKKKKAITEFIPLSKAVLSTSGPSSALIPSQTTQIQVEDQVSFCCHLLIPMEFN